MFAKLLFPVFRKKTMLRLGSVVVLSALFWTVYAEETDTLKHYNLDALIITGIKDNNDKISLPASAATVTAETMQRRQITEIKNFTGMIPNFIMLDRDTRLTSSVFVRGIGSLINSPSVAMYVDDVPHFEKSSFDIDLHDVEKIEFLRGSQGTLYGRNAMGGIILIHTRSPFRHRGTDIRLRYGSYNQLEASVSHRGNIGRKTAYSVSGNYSHSDGYIYNAFTKKKADKLNSGSVNTKWEWRPQTNIGIRLTNRFDLTRQGAFTYGDVNADKNYVESVNINYPSRYARRIYDGGLQMNYHNKHFRIRSQTAVQLLDDEYRIDQDASPRDLYFAVQNEKQRLISEEIVMRGLNDRFYGWNFGVFAFNHHIDRATDVHLNMANPKYKLEKRYDDNHRGIAFFHQSTLNITSQLRLEAGIRYDYEKARSIHNEYKTVENGAPQATNNYDNPLTFGQFTPKASVQYFLTPMLHLYATAAKGYKTGGFNVVFETPEQRTFAPEYSWNYEIGAKGWLIQDRLYAEAVLFHIDIENQQIRQHLDLQGIKIFNAGKSASKGIELSVNANPFAGFAVHASYGLTHATFKEYVYSKTIDYSGNFLPYVPRNTVSAGAEYKIASKTGFTDEIILNADYRGIGEIFWHENNLTKQPYYSLLDASVTARKGKLTYSVWGKNLTDTRYLGYYFELANRKLGKPGRPFSAGVGVSISL